jgi:hypothetical protein
MCIISGKKKAPAPIAVIKIPIAEIIISAFQSKIMCSPWRISAPKEGGRAVVCTAAARAGWGMGMNNSRVHTPSVAKLIIDSSAWPSAIFWPCLGRQNQSGA